MGLPRFSVFGTKSRFIEAFLNYNLDFSNILYQNLLFGAGRSRALMGGAGADNFPLCGSRKKNIWSRSRSRSTYTVHML